MDGWKTIGDSRFVPQLEDQSTPLLIPTIVELEDQDQPHPGIQEIKLNKL